MQRMYKNILKDGNGDHKYLRCPYPQYENFEVLCSVIALNEVDLVCAETVRA